MPRAVAPLVAAADLQQLFLASAEAAGWRIVSNVRNPDRGADAALSRGKYRYVVEFKAASEGRRDRLVPLLSQAILQARSFAAADSRPARALAVISAPQIPELVAKAVREFAEAHAPDVAIGILDREGLRIFVGPGLESLNAPARPASSPPASGAEPSIELFSDLNQWMLKVLLAPHIDRVGLMPANLPRIDYRNASELAKAARVSVMSAFRFVRQLEREGFLDEPRDRLRLVRLEALLERWQSASLKSVRELPARWLLARGDHNLSKVAASLGGPSCLALFAAARALGLGHVHGVSQHIYVRDFRADALKRAGLVKAAPGEHVDVVLRIPSVRESVFRGVVNVDDLPVSDVLQVWLDVAAHPTRGKEQADVIGRRVIKPMIEHLHAAGR